MKEEIITRLNDVETEECVKILYACESGSRAWGFPSANSDFDVRFLYLHPKDLKGEQVWIKKYFYVLRPILAINWLERGWGIVPTDFRVMVNQLFNSGELKREIEKLINAKMLGEELDSGPRIPVISNFIDREIERLDGKQFTDSIYQCSADQLNSLLRSALDDVWS